MSRVNGELLQLFRAERLREREACIETIYATVEQVLSLPPTQRPSLSEVIDLMAEKIRSQP